MCVSESEIEGTNVTLLFLTSNHATSTSRLLWHREMKKVWQGFHTFLNHLLALPQRLHLLLPSPSAAVQPHQCQAQVPWRRAAAAGPAGTREPNWGPRTLPSAATAVLPLADGGIKTPWLARGQRSSGGCSACRARGGLRCDGRRIRQCCPAVCMNSDWSPQLLSLSLSLKGKHKDKWIWLSLKSLT